MFKDTLNRQMKRAFSREFRSSLKIGSLKKITKEGIFDPITETYSEETSEVYRFRGMFRKYKKSLVDGINIFNSDVKLTVLQDEVDFTFDKNDIVNDVWRVVDVREDTTEVFFSVQLRRIN